MVKTRSQSLRTPQKKKGESKKSPQSTKAQKQQKASIIEEQIIGKTPSPKKMDVEDVNHIYGWAPKYSHQFSLSDIPLSKSKQDFAINNLSSQYCYFQDHHDKNKIVSYLNQQTFSIVLRRPKHQYIQLLQEIQSLDRLIHKSQQLIKPFMRRQWRICDDQLLKQRQVLQIIQKVQIADKTQKILFSVQNPTCLFFLSHIKFQSLKIMTVQKCQVSNLQALAWMDCPNLQQINIKQTQIHSINALSKTNLKHLQSVSVRQNKIIDPLLSRMAMASAGCVNAVEYLYFPHSQIYANYRGIKEEICVENISSLVKSKGFANSIRKGVFYCNRISQLRVFKVLERKNQQIEPIEDDESSIQ